MPVAASDRDLIRRHRAGDRRARATFVERYLPLARSLAGRYRHTGEPFDDLVQVGCLGLVKAADRWDPEHGAAFASFATPTILGELRRHFRDFTWTVRPPRDLQELSLAVERVRERLFATSGREPAVSDLAEALGRPPSLIAEALRAGDSRWSHSLDTPVGEGYESVTLGDRLGGDEPGFARVEARLTLDKLLTVLDRRAREVLHLVYQGGLSQSQAAQRVGCSQVQVSRIVHGSLAELSACAAA